MSLTKRRVAPFKNGDLAYLSSKNMSLPKGHTRKLIPKYIGPYKIIRNFGNNSYELDLPDCLKQWGMHPVFHSSLLRIHVPNDDQLFLRQQEMQVADFKETCSSTVASVSLAIWKDISLFVSIAHPGSTMEGLVLKD